MFGFLKKIRFVKTIKVLAVLLIACLLLLQFWYTFKTRSTLAVLEKHSSSLIKEVGQMGAFNARFQEDIGEVRDSLRLPRKNYDDLKIVPTSNDDSELNTDPVQKALFDYVDYIVETKNFKEGLVLKKSLLIKLSEYEVFQKFLADQNLLLIPVVDNEVATYLKVTDNQSNIILNLALSKEEAKLYLKTPDSKNEINYNDFDSFSEDVIKFLTKNKSKLTETAEKIKALQKQVVDTVNSDNIKKILEDKNFEVNQTPSEKNLVISFQVSNKIGDPVGEIAIHLDDLKFYLVNNNNPEQPVGIIDLNAALPAFINKLDDRTFLEQKADTTVDSFKKLINDKGFQLLLSKNGLEFPKIPKEDEYKIYYNLYDKKGNLITTFILDKKTGTINIDDKERNKIENLLLFQREDKKKTLEIPKTLPKFTTPVKQKNTLNVLVAGRNGMMLDTMIFVHIDDNKKEIRMISVPRDLFYNGRKINAFAYSYGNNELKKALSEISGYHLDKYVIVEMYAFIDVIDFMGGIDVHLDKALVDPTYKVIDNGVEGTLHYEPGDYHLGGKEALRIARSRHSTSDFDRAKRQQIILQSLQNKAKDLRANDLETIYKIIKTVMAKTETDIGFDDAVSYFFKYQNYTIVSNSVLSTGNVLFSPPYSDAATCNRLVQEAKNAGLEGHSCETESHSYTLLPKDDNWDAIKWFFQQNFR